MRKLFRITLLSAMRLLSIQAANLFVPSAYAAAQFPQLLHSKKKSKVKKQEAKDFEGPHGKHSRNRLGHSSRERHSPEWR